MNTEEFSNEFDALLNSFSNGSAIILDEYEKSVYLTKAQETLVINTYSGKNAYEDSFESTEEIRRYLSNLVKTYTVAAPITLETQGLSKNSKFYEIPKDVWFITYESATLKDVSLGCWDESEIVVKPISQDEFYKVLNNPFRGVSKRRALRLDINDSIVEIVSDYNILRYLIRYVARPNPIILDDLPSNLSINGINTITECPLHSALHRVILEKAVRLAISDRLPSTRSE